MAGRDWTHFAYAVINHNACTYASGLFLPPSLSNSVRVSDPTLHTHSGAKRPPPSPSGYPRIRCTVFQPRAAPNNLPARLQCSTLAPPPPPSDPSFWVCWSLGCVAMKLHCRMCAMDNREASCRFIAPCPKRGGGNHILYKAHSNSSHTLLPWE